MSWIRPPSGRSTGPRSSTSARSPGCRAISAATSSSSSGIARKRSRGASPSRTGSGRCSALSSLSSLSPRTSTPAVVVAADRNVVDPGGHEAPSRHSTFDEEAMDPTPARISLITRRKQRTGEPSRGDAFMTQTLIRVKIAPKGMGLNDFVAFEEGYFGDEGLEVEFDWKIFRGTQSSWKGRDYFQRPQDQPYAAGESEPVIQGACEWGTICNASAGMGRVVADAYGESPWAIYVRPDSPIEKPEQLKDVPIAVGLRAGSHFNVPYRLEKFLPIEHIKTVNVGGCGARLKALLEREVDAASLLPPQIDMAEELGLRKIIANTFRTIWWAPAAMPAGGR